MEIDFEYNYIENACKFLVAMPHGTWHFPYDLEYIGIKRPASGYLGHLVYNGFLERQFVRKRSDGKNSYKYKLTPRGEQMAGVLRRLGVHS